MKVLRVLSGLQRSPNEFIPVHKHVRATYYPQMTIWNLPEEIIVHLMKSLHIKDILSMRMVHPYFRHLIDNNQSVWASASFQDSWPSVKNLQHFERAAKVGNIESLVKLAIAYLYNEGLPGDFEGRKVTRNGIKAADMFCRIETLTPNTDPFTWLFIRPPWSMNGACCKECVFNYMKEFLKKDNNRKVQVCVAKTLQLLDNVPHDLQSYLQQAASQGSGIAAYMSWDETRTSMPVSDKAGELECIRKLRDIANQDYIEAKLQLCKYYAVGKYGGISKKKAMCFIRDFVHSVPALNTQESFQRSQELTASMRYILVDWLAEVAAMKEFSTHTFHVAVSVVDRFLRIHPVSRSKLQLLGVSAMVLCSRFLGKDIITIREAAWLTDNTYKYEDVVRMMGEITATLRGNIRVMTSVDFVEVFNSMVGHDKRLGCLTRYVCELALLQAEMGQYSPAEIAASAVLLSRLLLKVDNPWPSALQEATSFSIEDLNRCAFHIHEKCFLEGSVVDHREVTLQAVKQRYADEECCRVSEIEIISYKELCSLLGVTDHIVQGSDIHVKFRNDDELIVSPSRRKRRKSCKRQAPNPIAIHCSLRSVSRERERVNMPRVESPKSQKLNDSMLSGYDGDQEDDLEDNIDLSELEASFDNPKQQDIADEWMASDSDTLFGSISGHDHGQQSPQKMNFRLSVASPCRNRLSFNSQNIFCDSSSDGCAASSSCDAAVPSSSFSPDSQSFSSLSHSFSSLKPTSMTLRSASTSTMQGACGFLSSDSDASCDVGGASSSKHVRNSPQTSRHMTLRITPKRKVGRYSEGKVFVFK